MRRGVALFLVGSATLLTLVGCGRMAFEQREPWRRQAEAACVKSGAVKQSAASVAITAINGPGVCGADYPFKVAALGDRTILGYSEAVRPPGAIPRGFPIVEPRPVASPARYADPPAASAPMSLHAPGIEPVGEEEPEGPEEPETGADDDQPSAGGFPPAAQPSPRYPTRQVETAPQPDPRGAALPRLGPERTPLSFRAAAVVPTATLACPLVSRLDQWMASAVQPAAQRWFGQQVVELKQSSAYSCRGMTGNPRARISEHAFGNALDIAAFTLADGRRVTVKNGWHGTPEEQGFLRDVHAAACEHFSTVLAPGSNRFHYDHIHVDLMRRASGRRICNPNAEDGELVAARAAGQRGYARRGEPSVTGSVAKPKAPPKRFGRAQAFSDEDEWVEDEPLGRDD